MFGDSGSETADTGFRLKQVFRVLLNGKHAEVGFCWPRTDSSDATRQWGDSTPLNIEQRKDSMALTSCGENEKENLGIKYSIE